MTLFQQRTKEEQTDSLASYLKQGEITEAAFVPNTNTRKFLRALACELERYQSVLNDTMDELDIRKTQSLINLWEEAFGIQKTCFRATDNLEEKRWHLKMMLNQLHVNNVDDLINLCSALGFEITVENPKEHGMFPAAFPIYFFPSGKAVLFTMIINIPPDSEPIGFPLPFPFAFSSPSNQLLQCLINRVKPANVMVLYTYT